MTAKQKPATIYAALSAAQAAMGRALKDVNNQHFKTKYADLASVQDACMPALLENGFAVIQPVERDDAGNLYVRTILAHESGETLECAVPLMIGKNDMQGLGSAITYARRYGLLCMSGVAPEDDDGNAAVQNKRGDGPVVEPNAPATITADQLRELSEKAESVGADPVKFAQFLGVGSLDKLPRQRFADALAALDAKAAKQRAA